MEMENAKINRPPHQLWIYYEWESQTYMKTGVKSIIDDQFNYTITVRRDSDIWAPYGTFRKLQNPRAESRNLSAIFQNKTMEAMWLVTHGNTPSKRELVAKRLAANGFNISVFGNPKAFNWANVITRNVSDLPNYCRKVDFNSPESCNDKIAERFKFYLSFENSLCKDYVTEKLYNFLKYGTIIPVVYNAADMRFFAPPNSFINVADFSNTEELAAYLHEVANNETLYTNYLKWYTDYDIEESFYGTSYTKHFCTLCEQLTTGTNSKKSYQSVSKWYHTDQCFSSNPNYTLNVVV